MFFAVIIERLIHLTYLEVNIRTLIIVPHRPKNSLLIYRDINSDTISQASAVRSWRTLIIR